MKEQQDSGHRPVEVELSLEEVSMLRSASSAIGMNVMSFIETLSHDYLVCESKGILDYFNNIEKSLNSIEIER